MTDNEIVKALECCADLSSDCDNCAYRTNDYTNDCIVIMSKDALDLIKRQKAEINKLTYQVNRLKKYDEERDIRLHARLTANARAEAIKEFAERLHCHCESIINEPWNEKVYPNSWACAYQEFEDVVDNLVKEMVGDTQ